MEESRPPSTANKRKEETLFKYKKRGCLLTAASFEQGFGYLKAAAAGGLTKKITAKTEKEATDADLQVAKMQVAAADHAEDIKKRLD